MHPHAKDSWQPLVLQQNPPQSLWFSEGRAAGAALGKLTLCLAGMKRYCWRRVDTVLYFWSTSTLAGSRRQARCSFCTLLVMVAEKSCVRRSCSTPHPCQNPDLLLTDNEGTIPQENASGRLSSGAPSGSPMCHVVSCLTKGGLHLPRLLLKNIRASFVQVKPENLVTISRWAPWSERNATLTRNYG